MTIFLIVGSCILPSPVLQGSSEEPYGSLLQLLSKEKGFEEEGGFSTLLRIFVKWGKSVVLEVHLPTFISSLQLYPTNP